MRRQQQPRLSIGSSSSLESPDCQLLALDFNCYNQILLFSNNTTKNDVFSGFQDTQEPVNEQIRMTSSSHNSSFVNDEGGGLSEMANAILLKMIRVADNDKTLQVVPAFNNCIQSANSNSPTYGLLLSVNSNIQEENRIDINPKPWTLVNATELSDVTKEEFGIEGAVCGTQDDVKYSKVCVVHPSQFVTLNSNDQRDKNVSESGASELEMVDSSELSNVQNILVDETSENLVGLYTNVDGECIWPELIANLQKNDNRRSDNHASLQQFVDELLQGFKSTIDELKFFYVANQSAASLLETDVIKSMIQMLGKISDQALFYLVDWARRSYFFRDLMVSF